MEKKELLDPPPSSLVEPSLGHQSPEACIPTASMIQEVSMERTSEICSITTDTVGHSSNGYAKPIELCPLNEMPVDGIQQDATNTGGHTINHHDSTNILQSTPTSSVPNKFTVELTLSSGI